MAASDIIRCTATCGAANADASFALGLQGVARSTVVLSPSNSFGGGTREFERMRIGRTVLLVRSRGPGCKIQLSRNQTSTLRSIATLAMDVCQSGRFEFEYSCWKDAEADKTDVFHMVRSFRIQFLDNPDMPSATWWTTTSLSFIGNEMANK